MSFAFPIAFALAALALPIAVLYILKVRLRRVPVSTNLFWKQIYKETPPRSLWQHFRDLLSLLLQLLLLLLIVLAVADPYFSWQILHARRLVLVIDNSASMRATDVGPSRLAAAKAAASEIIDGMRFRDEVAVVLAGSRPEVLVGMSSHAPTLRRAIDGVSYSDNSTELAAAIDLGRQLIGPHPHGQVIVFTDGAVDHSGLSASREGEAPVEPPSAKALSASDTFASIAMPIEYRLFAADAANVGITQLQVRRSLIDPLGYEILASVFNASTTDISCRLELTLDDVPVDVIPLNLKPDERWSRAIEKTSLEGGRLRGELTRVQSDAGVDSEKATPRENLNKLDQLSADNSAWAILPSRKTQRVLIVSQGNLFLQKVFEANPLVEVTTRKDFPEQWPADSIIVLHGNVPDVLPAGNVFVIDPIGNCDQWEQGTVMENPIVTEQDKASPLMNHIRLDNVIMPDAKQLQFTTPPHSLAATLSGDSVYAEVRRSNGKCLVLSVSLDRSDLAFRTAFPIMVANSIGWFSGSTGELQQSLPTGAITTVTISDATSAGDDLDLNSPGGITMPLVVGSVDSTTVINSAVASVSATIGPLNEVGVWSVSYRRQALQNQMETRQNPLAEIAVNLTSARETDLRPMPELVESSQTRAVATVWFSQPFWFYLIIAALILTSLEWILYQRRLIS